MVSVPVGERQLTLSQAINEAIRAGDAARSDASSSWARTSPARRAARTWVWWTPGAGRCGRRAGSITEFGPERVIDTPIAEMGFVGAAVGAAMTGLRPIVEVMFVDLIGVCYDQIVNQAAKMHYMMGGQVRLPLVIRTAFGSRGDKRTYGGGAAAQHSQTLYSVLAHVSGPEGRRAEHRLQRQGPARRRLSETTVRSW